MRTLRNRSLGGYLYIACILSLITCGRQGEQSPGQDGALDQRQEGGYASPGTGNLDGNLDVRIKIVQQEVEVASGVILRVLDADVPAGGATIQLPIMLYPDSAALPTAGQFNVILDDGLTLTKVTAGKAARDAEKEVYFNPANNNIILFVGINRTPITGGELVILTIEIAPQISNLRRICLSGAIVVNGEADELLVQTKCGTITEY